MSGKKKKSKAGRKWFDGKNVDEVRAKLEAGAQLDVPVEKCCTYAQISRYSYHRYLKAHPDFATKLQSLRLTPSIKARQNVVKSIVEEKDVENSKWWLERRERDEFNLRQQVEHTGEVDLNLEEIINKKIADHKKKNA